MSWIVEKARPLKYAGDHRTTELRAKDLQNPTKPLKVLDVLREYQPIAVA
jgi:hypothetical protein